MPYSITEQFVSWLNSLGYTASTYPAANVQTPFITVERVGGGITDMVDRPQMALQFWADTEADAEELANEVRSVLVLGNRPSGVFSLFVSQGPYPFWDESTDKPRYQLVLDCTSKI